VPAVLFRHTRTPVLRGFLERESIFTRGAFHGDELRAREHLERSIARLG